MRVLVPDVAEFRALAVPGVELMFFAEDHVPGGEADGAVLWLVPARTRAALLATPGLNWVLTLTAGIEHVAGQLPPGVALYNAHTLHDRAVAVHTLAGMLGAERRLHLFRDAQQKGEWSRTSDLGTLDGLKVTVWGHGHIGRILEDLLRPLGAEVTGIRSRTPRPERDAALAGADWVILLLPSTPETRGIVNADVLSRLKPGAWISNQGRGNLIQTPDLLAALDSGHLGGAVLDVTDPEPLPADHPLWRQRGVILTPHIASTTRDLTARAAEHTRKFLSDLAAGREPEGRVEAGNMY